MPNKNLSAVYNFCCLFWLLKALNFYTVHRRKLSNNSGGNNKPFTQAFWKCFYSLSGMFAQMYFSSGLSQMAPCPKLKTEQGRTCNCKEPDSNPKSA